MSALVLGIIAAITYGSRAVSLALLPRAGARFEAILARMPAPIFAGLATATLVTGDRCAGRRPHPLGRPGRAVAQPGPLAPVLPDRGRGRLRAGDASRG